MHWCDSFCFVVETNQRKNAANPGCCCGRLGAHDAQTKERWLRLHLQQRRTGCFFFNVFFLPNLQQTTGWCLGYILFLTMEGAGLVTLGGCLENYPLRPFKVYTGCVPAGRLSFYTPWFLHTHAKLIRSISPFLGRCLPCDHNSHWWVFHKFCLAQLLYFQQFSSKRKTLEKIKVMEKMWQKSHPLVWWKHTGVIAKMIPLHKIIWIFSQY